MKQKYIKTLILGSIFIMLLSCGSKHENAALQNIRFVSFWEGFDFADKSHIDNPGVTNPKFESFCKYLSSTTTYDRRQQIDTLLNRSLQGGIDMYENMMQLAEKYLTDPNSPYRNEETYIQFLEYTISNPNLTEAYKERPRFQLTIAKKNRVGTIANDFEYVTREGRHGILSNIRHKYTLLYFNNPGCHDCKRVTEYIKHSSTINKLISNNNLTLLAVYPDEELTEWEEHKAEYPEKWVVCRYASEQYAEAYNLPAIPNLYLLDSKKSVIFKDAPIEEIETYLRRTEYGKTKNAT